MTGVQMLLKQVGLDPEKVQKTYEQLTTQLPVFLNALGGKVVEIEQALIRIEANQKLILKKLGVTSDGIECTAVTTSADSASGSGDRTN